MEHFHTMLTQEEQLIILLSRLSFSEENEKEIERIIKNKLDWFRVFKMAIKNKVVPLIWKNLSVRHFDEAIFPPSLKMTFLYYYLGTKERNHLLLKELKKVAIAMDSVRIPLIPVKGAYLIPHLYKDFGVKLMSDIDCLVRKTDTEILRSIMNSLGYSEGEYDPTTNSIMPFNREKSLLWKMGSFNLLPFLKVVNSRTTKFCMFDLSFALDFNRDTEVIEKMLSRAVKKIRSRFTYLRPSDFFIHQCCHHYKEAIKAEAIFAGKDLNIIKFCDTREYILHKMNSQQLAEAVQTAILHGYEKAVYFTLYYLDQIYHDGYEGPLLKTINIKDTGFLETFGQKDFGYEIVWKKDFWQRLFSDNNSDEMPEIPKHIDILNNSGYK